MLQGLLNFLYKYSDNTHLAYKGIDIVHEKVHMGKHFTVCRAAASVANAASVDIRFKPGDVKCHAAFQISASGKAQFFIYEAATISAGTALTAYNNDRASARPRSNYRILRRILKRVIE